MQKRLFKSYLGMLIPALVCFAAGFLNSHLGIITIFSSQPGEALVVAVFILSLVFAIALPILIRTLFANSQRNNRQVQKTDFLNFERRLIRTALVAPYLSLVAYLYRFPEFYLAGSFLAALYAVYYFFPSERRIAYEKRIFRVQAE